MNLLCIALDRLHIGYLGCFGSTWVATPAIDRLASGGFVLDQAIVDSLDLAMTYDSWWRGTHAVERQRNLAGPTFAELARAAGRQTFLAADDPLVLEHPAGAAFDDVLELPPPPTEAATASDVNQTHAAQSFAAISQKLAELREPFAAWIHSSTLGGAWDAPAEFRERYRDEEDPPIPTFTALASQTLPRDADLDDRFAIALAYAGQVSLVDACLGGLLEHLEETGLDRETAIVLMSPRGLALGEHREVGFHDGRLYAENVHVPWIVRLPGRRGRLRRSQALVQPCDLLPTVGELFSSSGSAASNGFARSIVPLIDATAATVRDRAPITASGETGLRTRHWSIRIPESQTSADAARPELFVKPDDFWEVNDVADRLPAVAEELQQSLSATVAALAAGETPPPLPEVEQLLDAG
jgi:arylsulfatase A-like enzyme